MKQLFYFALLFIPFFSVGQIVSVDYIINKESITKTEAFVNSGLKFYQTSLELGFDKHKIKDNETIKLLRSKTIYKVELYYSSYRSSSKFEQKELNRKRLRALKKRLPSLFENNAIEWQLIEQVQNDEKAAKKLFHGFVFYSREPYVITRDGKTVKITANEEIEIIKNYLDDTLPIDYVSNICFEFERVCDTTYTNVPTGRTETKINYTGMYLPKSKRKRSKGILYKKKSIWNRPKETTIEKIPIYESEAIINCTEKSFAGPYITVVTSIDDMTKFSLTRDTVVIKTMAKNNWQNTMVVEDVTGSMYPYLAQTFKWRRLRIASSDIKNFAFFNDGDNKPDGPIGNSYGVYNVLSDSIDIVEETAYSTMKKGNGGNGPENDIEAMIKGFENSEARVSNIILVADNYSTVRDMSILNSLLKLNIPVHVIVCGAYKAVNYQYIEIALKTGGTVNTISEDIDFSSKMAEGAAITIGGQTFIIKKGELQLKID